MAGARQKVKDWGGLLAGIAALAGVGLTYIQALTAEDATTRQVAKQEAQLEQAYQLLVTAVNRLSDQASQRDQLIGDMREAIGEIRGALALLNRRAERTLKDAEALDRVAPRHRAGRRPASATSSSTPSDVEADEAAPMEPVQEQVQVQLELPKIAPDVVDQKVMQMKGRAD